MNQDSKPLIVQGDGSLLLDVHNVSFEKSRGEISAYAELEKSPEHVHTYRISPLSLWNAAGSGWMSDKIEASLNRWSRYPVPENIISQIRDILSRWGKLRLTQFEQIDDNPDEKAPGDSELWLRLEIDDEAVREELKARKSLSKWLVPSGDGFL
ncbi:MAG: helicase-associated domain-containing protein, partial [Spirochaetaceae bacterium]|nr:helicase-associated domain-containing protein [Spirochaetaceae bacterium]